MVYPWYIYRLRYIFVLYGVYSPCCIVVTEAYDTKINLRLLNRGSIAGQLRKSI